MVVDKINDIVYNHVMEIVDTVNLEEDIKNCPELVAKIKQYPMYAQNVYAALCNIVWYKTTEFLPLLKGNNEWTCSWRYAGGIMADIIGTGDYMDFYCSGIRGDEADVEENNIDIDRPYIAEGGVTDEITTDFKKMGWQWKEYDDKDTWI